MVLKLFNNLKVGEWFHWFDNPGRKLMKADDTHYLSRSGLGKISPTVAIFTDKEGRKPDNVLMGYSGEKGEYDGNTNQ